MFQFKSNPPPHTHKFRWDGSILHWLSFFFFFLPPITYTQLPFYFSFYCSLHLSIPLREYLQQLTRELVLLFQEKHCSALAEPKSCGNLLTARAGVFAVSGQILGSACISGFNKLLYFNAKRINLNSHSRQPVLSQNIVFKLRQHPVYIDKQIHSPQSFFQLEQLLST